MQTLRQESRNYYLLFNLPLQIIGILSLFLITNAPLFLLSFLISYIIIYWVGIQAGAHKLFSHRSWTPKNDGIKYFLAIVSCFGLMGGPVIWSQMHRYHHIHEDTDLDPHSPKSGKLHSYFMWLLDVKNSSMMNIKDLLKDKKLLRINYNCREIVLYTLLFLLILNFNIFAGVILASMVTFHCEMSVNTFLHYYNTESNKWESKNNIILSLFSGGSSLHRNHHDDMRSCNFSKKWYQFDLSYLFVRMLRL